MDFLQNTGNSHNRSQVTHLRAVAGGLLDKLKSPPAGELSPPRAPFTGLNINQSLLSLQLAMSFCPTLAPADLPWPLLPELLHQPVDDFFVDRIRSQIDRLDQVVILLVTV